MAVKITPKGRLILKGPNDKCNFTITELQKLVGGPIELLRLVNTQIIVVNADKAQQANEVEKNKTGQLYSYFHQLNREIYGSFLVCNKLEIEKTLYLMEMPVSLN